MSDPPRGPGPDDVLRPDPLWDDERLVLLVIASGPAVMTASATLQVLWLVTLLLAPLVPRWLAAPHRGPDGGGGGGGLRDRGGPRPTRPSGVK
jgi:hypothetical protein